MRNIPIKKYDKLYEIAQKMVLNDEKYHNGIERERWNLILTSLDALRFGLVKPKNKEVTSFADLYDPKIEWIWK